VLRRRPMVERPSRQRQARQISRERTSGCVIGLLHDCETDTGITRLNTAHPSTIEGKCHHQTSVTAMS
jgi:hypothetical protein